MGILNRGATKVVIFDGKLIATKYTKIVLLPFIKESYPNSHRFFQHNDPKPLKLSKELLLAVVWGSMKKILKWSS